MYTVYSAVYYSSNIQSSIHTRCVSLKENTTVIYNGMFHHADTHHSLSAPSMIDLHNYRLAYSLTLEYQTVV